MLRTLILVIATVVAYSFVPSSVNGDDPFVRPDKVSNAALVYWQAFALLPDLSDEETKQLDQIMKGKTPVASAGSILDKSETSLKLIQIIKPQTKCRWELIEDGPGTLLPHLGKARLLTRLMIVKAKLDATEGRTDASVERLTSAFTLSRNIDEGVLIQMLVSDSIETTIMDVATPLLPSFGVEARKQLSRNLKMLAPKSTLAKAIEYERDVFGGWIGEIMDRDKGGAQDSLSRLGWANNTSGVEQILVGTKQDRKDRLSEFISEYDKAIAASKMPMGDAEKIYKRLEESHGNSPNPLIRLLMPSLERANNVHSKFLDRLAKFESALKDGSQR